MAKTQAELDFEYRRVAAKGDTEYFKALTRSISDREEDVSRGYQKLSSDTARLKGQIAQTVGRYYASRDSGSSAQRMRSAVELGKLMVEAPTDFAKAAYAPDLNTLRTVQMGANPNGDANAADPRTGIPQKAWQIFYATTPLNSGNLWGTYREMERLYGPDKYNLGSEGDLEARRQEVQAQLKTERGAAENWQQAYNAVTNLPGAFASFLAKNPNLDPNADETYAAFAKDAGVLSLIPKIEDPAFLGKLEQVVNDPRSYEDDLYRDDALTGIRKAEEARDRELALREKIALDGETPAAQTEDTDEDLLAAWLKRPDVQAWAKANGLRVGRVEEITPEMQADLDAGRIPRSSVTKYGVYTPGRDDYKAADISARQMKIDPNRNLFRNAGIGQKQTVVEVEIGVDPEKYRDPDNGKFYKDAVTGKYVPIDEVRQNYVGSVGLTPDGLIAARPDGTYVWSTDDGMTWNTVPKAAGDRLMETVTETLDGGVVGVNVVEEPPKTKTVQGTRRRPLPNDAVGSVRLFDPETGREEYVSPEHVRRVVEPGLRADATPQTLAGKIGEARARGAMKRQGFAEDENEMDIGEKPNPADVRARHREVEKTRRGEERTGRIVERMENRADRIGGNAERLEALAGAAPNESAQRRLFARASKKREKETTVRQEANATREPSGRLPVVPDESLDEGLNPRKSTDAAVARHEQAAKMSDTDGPNRQSLDRREKPGLTGRDFRDANPAGAAAKAAGPKDPPRATTDAKTPSTTTPTATTTDPRRKLFKAPSPLPAEPTL